MPAEAVTGSYFLMLGIEAALGRTLLPSDDVSRGGYPVAMLDHRYWRSAFGGEPDLVGTRDAGRQPDLHGDRGGARRLPGPVRGLTPAFYAPNAMVEELNGSRMLDNRAHQSLLVKARLRPGVTLTQAETAAGAVAAQFTRDRIESWDPAGRFVPCRSPTCCSSRQRTSSSARLRGC